MPFQEEPVAPLEATAGMYDVLFFHQVKAQVLN
jgi:hypothetical protein